MRPHMSKSKNITGCISSWLVQGWVTGSGLCCHTGRTRRDAITFVLFLFLKMQRRAI